MSDYGKTFSKLAQHFALKSTNRSTFFRGNSATWLNKCMHGQPKIGCNTPQAMYIATTLCFCPKMASEAISGNLFS